MSKLEDLVVDDPRISAALKQGINQGRKMERAEHQCPKPKPYPKELMRRMDALKDEAHELAEAWNAWLVSS